MELALDIYKISGSFPKEEQYGMTSQIRRSAISVPSNIAEGCARFSDKETYNFVSIALGSLAEMETQLILSKQLGYLEDDEKINELIKKVNALLIGLKKRIEKDIS